MSTDELWALHEKVAATLIAKIIAEKEVLEDRLKLLTQDRGAINVGQVAETTQLGSGKPIDDFS